ncbi:variable large family protein, partial [Borrelia hispanica]
KLKESNLVLNQQSIGIANPENGAKVLTAGANAGGASGPEAVAIVSAVSSEEILESIVKSKENDVKSLSGNAVAGTTPLEFAKGTNNTGHLAQGAAKAAAVAGGIALRSLVKDGKLAANNNNDEKAVQGAGISAVNKLLVAIEDIIKKTVKNVLEKVKQEVDKARATKVANHQ